MVLGVNTVQTCCLGECQRPDGGTPLPAVFPPFTPPSASMAGLFSFPGPHHGTRHSSPRLEVRFQRLSRDSFLLCPNPESPVGDPYAKSLGSSGHATLHTSQQREARTHAFQRRRLRFREAQQHAEGHTGIVAEQSHESNTGRV